MRFALLKGWRNYLCLMRLEQARGAGAALFDDGGAGDVEQIAEWAEKTQDGSLADLPIPATLERMVRRGRTTKTTASAPGSRLDVRSLSIKVNSRKQNCSKEISKKMPGEEKEMVSRIFLRSRKISF